jgi:hypothetical protein
MFNERAHEAMNASAVAIGRPRPAFAATNFEMVYLK